MADTLPYGGDPSEDQSAVSAITPAPDEQSQGYPPPPGGAPGVSGVPTPTGMSYPYGQQPQAPPGGMFLPRGIHYVKPPPSHADIEGLPSPLDYIMRHYNDDGKHNTVANLSDNDILLLLGEYADTHYQSAYEAQGQQFDKANLKSKIDTLQSGAMKKMPQLRALLAAEEAKNKGAAPAPSDSSWKGLLDNPVVNAAKDIGVGAIASIPEAAGGLQALGTQYVTNPLRRAAMKAGLRPDITPEQATEAETKDMAQASSLMETGEKFGERYGTPESTEAFKKIEEDTAKFNADPNNNIIDKILHTVKAYGENPEAIPRVLGGFALPIGEAGAIEKGLVKAALPNVLKKSAQNLPFAVQQAGALPISAYRQAKQSGLSETDAAEAAKVAAYSPQAGIAVLAMLAPIGSTRVTGAGITGVKGTVVRTIGQAIQFGSAAAASKIAENKALGKPEYEGVENAFASNAAMAIPVTVGFEGVHAALRSSTTPPGKAPGAKTGIKPPPAGAAPAATGAAPGSTPPTGKPTAPSAAAAAAGGPAAKPTPPAPGPLPAVPGAAGKKVSGIFNSVQKTYAVKPGEMPEVTLAEALDDLENQVTGLQGVTPAHVAQLKSNFEAIWRQQNNQPVAMGAGQPALTEAMQPSATEAAAVTMPEPAPTPSPLEAEAAVAARGIPGGETQVTAGESPGTFTLNEPQQTAKTEAQKNQYQKTTEALNAELAKPKLTQNKTLIDHYKYILEELDAEMGGKPGAEASAGEEALPEEQPPTATNVLTERRKATTEVSGRETIPVMITMQMRSHLKDMGYTDELIRKMTPQEAHDVLTNQVTPDKFTPKTVAEEKSVEPLGAPESRGVHKPLKAVTNAVRALGPDISERYPTPIIEAVLKTLRGEGRREPDVKDIEHMADSFLHAAGVSIEDVPRREALGELIKENPNKFPTKEEITKKAGELMDRRNNRSPASIVNERLAAREQHPDTTFRRILERERQREKDQAREERKQKAREKPLTLEEQIQNDLEEHREQLAVQAAAKNAPVEPPPKPVKKDQLRAAPKITAPVKPKGGGLKKAKAEAAATVQSAVRIVSGITGKLKAKFARREPLPLYSAVQRFVDYPVGVPTLKTAAAWKKWFDNAQSKGIFKKSERNWLGVDTFLDDKADISLEEIQRFIRDSRRIAIDVQAQTESGGGEYLTPEEQNDIDLYRSMVRDSTKDNLLTDEEWDKYAALIAKKNMLSRDASWGPKERQTGSFDYINWPGGTGYEERMLHEAGQPTKTDVNSLGEIQREKELELRYMSQQEGMTDKLRAREEQVRREGEEVERLRSIHEKAFRSPHMGWMINPIGHTRGEQRVAITGEKVEHIGEFQAEAHQAAAHRGYRVPGEYEAVIAEQGQAEKDYEKAYHDYDMANSKYEDRIDRAREAVRNREWRIDELAHKAKYRLAMYKGQSVWDIKQKIKNSDIQYKELQKKLNDLHEAQDNDTEITRLRAEKARLYELSNSLGDRAYTLSQGVPDIPFKTPEEWVLALFKDRLKKAVEQGQDAVSWTTGEQQVDRYAMGGNAESIKIRDTFGEGNREITISLVGGGDEARMTIDKDGMVDMRHWPRSYDDNNPWYEGKSLKNILGKGKADEIMSTKGPATISGDNIFIGPKFHRTIYDEIAPKVIGDYVRQLGEGKVVKADSPEAIKFDIPITERQAGRERYSSWNKQLPHGEVAVHSVKITPEMREAVLGKDQAAFIKGEKPERTPYSLPENLPSKLTEVSKLLSNRVSSWYPGKTAKFEAITSDHLPQDLKDIVHSFADTGKKIIFVKNLTHDVETFEGINFGDRILYIDEAAQHPIVQVVTHEFGHDLKTSHPELYQVMHDEVKRQLDEKGTLPAWTTELVKKGYENVTDASAIEELVGNGIGDAFANREFLEQLAQRNPTVFGRIAEAFTKYVNALLKKLGVVKDLGSNAFIHDVQGFRDKLLSVLEKYDPVQAQALEAQSNSTTPKFARRAVTTPEDAKDALARWDSPASLMQNFNKSKPEVGVLNPTKWQNIAKTMSNTLQPLQDYNYHMARQGHKIDTESNMYMHFTNLRGRQKHEMDADHADYINPILDHVRVLSAQTGIPQEKLMGLYSNWVLARDAINTNKRYELENVELSPDAEQKRADLKLKLRDPTYTGNYEQELKNIVLAPGARVGGALDPVSGMTTVDAHQIIRDTIDAGFSDDLGESINEQFNPLRNRIDENRLKSGSMSDLDLKQQNAYKNPYAMPKSNWADEDIRTPQNVFGSPLGKFTRAYYGDIKLSDDPVERIFTKLLFSSKDVADNEATESLRNAILDPDQELGGTIRSYDMDKLITDHLEKGNKLGSMKRYAAGPNTIIHNRGKYRDVITLPDNSPQLQAIKESQHPVELDPVSKRVGVLTGLYGRFHTALSPVFALVNAVIRDGLYIPGMMNVQGKQNLVPGYVYHYVRHGGPFGAWRAYLQFPGKAATYEEIREFAKTHPNSFAGKLYELEQNGGGFNFRDEFNNAKKIERLVKQMAKDSQKFYDPRKIWRWAVELQDALATGSMMAGRVAAWEAAVDKGMTKKEAAFYSKRLLDYQQTSEGSRFLNSWFAFARVGITSADAALGAMKNEKGYIDKKRAMLGATLFMAGATGVYAALKSALGDDKTKGLSDDALAKNIVIHNPYDPSQPIQLPIGLGMPRLAWGVAMMAVRYAQGDTTAKSAGRTIKNLLLENVSPLHPIESKEGADSGTIAQDIAGALVPSIARPGYESGINQTAFGSQIHESPEYTKGFKSESGRLTTGNMYKNTAKFLRENTGLDVYPETLRHMLSSYDPGIANLLFKSLEKEDMKNAGLDVDASSATIFAGIFNHDLKYAGGKEFYHAKEALEEARKEQDVLVKGNKIVPRLMQEKVDLDKEFEKASKAHGREVRAVKDNALMSTAVRTSKLAAIQRNWEKTQRELAQQASRLRH